jgi:small subunit ribosomal protein S9
MSERKYVYATGKRKTSIAKVRLYPNGRGQITINDKPIKEYLTVDHQFSAVYAPLKLVDGEKSYDLSITVQGGGVTGQAEAIRHGVTKALVIHDPSLRTTLKKEGLLTRDPRAKERKKPGLKRARRAPQWAKR